MEAASRWRPVRVNFLSLILFCTSIWIKIALLLRQDLCFVVRFAIYDFLYQNYLPKALIGDSDTNKKIKIKLVTRSNSIKFNQGEFNEKVDIFSQLVEVGSDRLNAETKTGLKIQSTSSKFENGDAENQRSLALWSVVH